MNDLKHLFESHKGNSITSRCMSSWVRKISIIIVVSNLAFFGVLYAFLALFRRTIQLPEDLVKILPGDGFTDFALLLFLPNILVPVMSLVFAPLIIRLYIKLGLWLRFGQYGLAHHEYTKNFENPEIVARAFWAAVFNLTIGLTLTQYFINVNLEIIPRSTVSTIIILTLITSPIAGLIMAPMWWTEDLGIMLIRRAHPSLAPDISSVGRFMNYLMRGFITISTPILYGSVLMKEINVVRNANSLIPIIAFPFALMGFFIPMQFWFARRFAKFKSGFLPKLRLPPVNITWSIEIAKTKQ